MTSKVVSSKGAKKAQDTKPSFVPTIFLSIRGHESHDGIPVTWIKESQIVDSGKLLRNHFLTLGRGLDQKTPIILESITFYTMQDGKRVILAQGDVKEDRTTIIHLPSKQGNRTVTLESTPNQRKKTRNYLQGIGTRALKMIGLVEDTRGKRGTSTPKVVTLVEDTPKYKELESENTRLRAELEEMKKLILANKKA